MKMVKSLLLGSAAGIVAVAGAQAADLPVKAKPVEYVKICSLYGDGFYYVPGSDMCIRFAGAVRFEIGHMNNGSNDPIYSSTGGLRTRESEDIVWRARANLDIDTRTQTAYGTLRAFSRFRTESVDGGATGTEASTSPSVPRAFIQWTGFTVGRIRSFSDTSVLGEGEGGEGLGIPIIARAGNFHASTSSSGTIEASYTWELGNGNSLYVGAGERRGPSYTNLSNTTFTPGVNPTSSQAGQVSPSPYVAFKTNQAWGKWEATVSTQQLRALYYTAATPGFGACTGGNTGTTWCDAPNDRWGFSAAQGLVIKTPWLGEGDVVGVYAAYAQGMMAMAIGNTSASAGLYGSGPTVALGPKTDAVYINGSGLELTTVWSVNGGWSHWWSPQLSTSLWGAHWEISYNNTVINNRWWCGGSGGTTAIVVAATVKCDPGYSLSAAGVTTWWHPSPGFQIGVEVMYVQVGTAFDGQTVTLAKNGARPAGAYTAKDEGSLNSMLRIQRSWPPAGE